MENGAAKDRSRPWSATTFRDRPPKPPPVILSTAKDLPRAWSAADLRDRPLGYGPGRSFAALTLERNERLRRIHRACAAPAACRRLASPLAGPLTTRRLARTLRPQDAVARAVG